MSASSDSTKKEPEGNSSSAQSILELAELAGGLAHELRNPLSTIMINLKLLAENLEDRAAGFEDVRRRALLRVDSLRREAERLQALFDDFLNLTGPCRIAPTVQDLNATVAEMVTFFEPVAKRAGITLLFQRETDRAPCRFDDKMLKQALLNLLINAKQAMLEGGRITLRTQEEADRVLLEVEDQGPGIRPDDLDRIFQPFFSTKPQGSGLGLAITRRIVQEHGGSLTVTSDPGCGATFHIRLPRDRRRLPDMPGAC